MNHDLARVLGERLVVAEDVAIMRIGDDGRFLDWSAGAERVFGHPRATINGQAFEILFTPEDRDLGVPAEELAAARRLGSAADDRWHLRADGSRIWVGGVTYALGAGIPGGPGFIKVARNLTALRELTEELRSQLAECSRLREGQVAFVATLAHEIRSPLAAIRTALALTDTFGEGDGRERRKLLDLMSRQSELMVKLVDDLMDASRFSIGKAPLALSPIDLRKPIVDALEARKLLAQERGQRVDRLLTREPVTIMGDATKLVQVFSNLLDNAIKHTPEGGRIAVRLTIDGNEALVRVTDTGEGIAAEMQARIFDLFTQADRGRQGLGIGLALVKSIVAAHGGSVQVTSDGPGNGSQFTVRLPRVAARKPPSFPDPRTAGPTE